MWESFKKVLSSIYKYILAFLALVFLGSKFTRARTSKEEKAKELKKDIKSEVKEVKNTVKEIEKTEEELSEVIEDTNKVVEETVSNQEKRNEDIKDFLVDL